VSIPFKGVVNIDIKDSTPDWAPYSQPMAPEGTLSLYIDDEKVGEGKIKTQPAKVSLAGEGLNVGMDRGEPVTGDYPGDSPWAFVGGTIHKVVVDVAGDPWVDLEKDVAAAFARD